MLKGEWWNIGGAADISSASPFFNASKYPLFFSPIFTLSFYPFHCNCSKSDACHLESLPQSLFQALYQLQSISRHIISLSLFVCLIFYFQSFTSSLVPSPIMCKSSYSTLDVFKHSSLAPNQYWLSILSVCSSSCSVGPCPLYPLAHPPPSSP